MNEKEPISPVVAGWLIFMAVVQLLFVTAKLWHQFDGSWILVSWPVLLVILLVCISIMTTKRKPPAE